MYRALTPAVLAYLRTQRVAEPEDVLGEVFLHVARDLHRVRGDDLAVRKWVFTLARNRAVDEARRWARQPQIADCPVPDVEAPPPDAGLLDAELTDALACLTPEQREVVSLRFVADLPVEAVARITDRSVGAVKAMQHRALAQLTQAVSREAQPTL